jgi:hypothetical protein
MQRLVPEATFRLADVGPVHLHLFEEVVRGGQHHVELEDGVEDRRLVEEIGEAPCARFGVHDERLAGLCREQPILSAKALREAITGG